MPDPILSVTDVPPVKPLPVFSDDPEIQTRCEAEITKRVGDIGDQLRKSNSKMIEDTLDVIRKQYGPPSTEQIQQLLNQEYLEFTVKVPWPGEEGAKHDFVIRELPQSIEKKFFKQIREHLLPRAKDIAALSFELVDGKTEDKIKSLLAAFEPAFDILADGVVLVLNPQGKEAEITRAWVQENVSSARMWSILEAQMMANRMRDFFSRLSLTVEGAAKKV